MKQSKVLHVNFCPKLCNSIFFKQIVEIRTFILSASLVLCSQSLWHCSESHTDLSSFGWVVLKHKWSDINFLGLKTRLEAVRVLLLGITWAWILGLDLDMYLVASKTLDSHVLFFGLGVCLIFREGPTWCSVVWVTDFLLYWVSSKLEIQTVENQDWRLSLGSTTLICIFWVVPVYKQDATFRFQTNKLMCCSRTDS